MILHDQAVGTSTTITILLNTHVEAIDAEAKQISWQMVKNYLTTSYPGFGCLTEHAPRSRQGMKGVQTLRTLDDADLFWEARRKHRAGGVCIGGGLWGWKVVVLWHVKARK